MPSIEDVVFAKMTENSSRLWLESWSQTIDWVLGGVVASKFEADSGRFVGNFPPINDLAWRYRELETSPELTSRCIDESMKHLNTLNVAITSELDSHGQRYSKRNATRMREHLRRVYQQLISLPESKASIATRTADDVWRAVAHQLARRAYEEPTRNHNMPELRLQNLLLIAGYFNACNLPREELVVDELNELGHSMLSIRGTLVDIVENVSIHGIGDRRPGLATFSGPLILHHQNLSPLIDNLVTEVANVPRNQGFLSRQLGPIATNAGARVNPQFLRRLRQAAYPQYEYTVLGFMALSAIEQLLRTYAAKAGLFEGHKRLTSGRIDKVADHLGGGTTLKDSLQSVFSASDGNLRNRVLHGVQLQIDRSVRQAILPMVRPSVTFAAPDPFSPQNVCHLCLDCLQILDHQIASQGQVTAADLSWTSHFDLTQEQIQFAQQLEFDSGSTPTSSWWDRIYDYVTAVTPSINVLCAFGIIGWCHPARSDSPVLFMALSMILEAMFRSTVQVQAGSILKREEVQARQHGLVFRYKMLDTNELCSPAVLERLVQGVEPSLREAAKRVLMLAVQVRDTVAHGAITTSGTDRDIAMGNLLLKAIQILAAAGEHEMTQIAAYFHWNASREYRTEPVANWLEGEREIRARFKQFTV